MEEGTSTSRASTLLQSPPESLSPHATTPPSAFSAAKAPQVSHPMAVLSLCTSNVVLALSVTGLVSKLFKL